MVGGTPDRTRLWFTIAEGMLTEIFYPCVDLAQIKELNFIIGDGQGFWTDLRGIADYEVEEPAPGVPALTIRHRHDRFCLISKICADPLRDVVLVDLQLQGEESLAAQPNEHRLGGAQSASEQLGIDFLQLVRYGLRRPDEPRVKATIKAVDALLKTETPSGPVWHRYTKDAYGEHADGSAFDGSGQGRGWPLLTGERGHYGLVAGEDPLPYLRAMVLMSGKGGLLPEQVWDNDPIPEHKLYPGKPTGSAMPLVWAHAEFIKLALSKSRRGPVDRPPRVRDRYHGNIPRRRWVAWSFRLKRRSIPRGFPLRLLLNAPATVHWGRSGWQDIKETETRDSGLSVHWAELPITDLREGETVNFTFRWLASGSWEGRDFEVAIAFVIAREHRAVDSRNSLDPGSSPPRQYISAGYISEADHRG
jgi:hypothetical protein